MGQKRQRDQKGSATPANKKNKAAKVTKEAAKDDSWDGIVTLDEISWKEVPMPDRLEDAEGFFGLEEIDGVDVVRHGTGEIQFKAAPGTAKASILKKKTEEENKAEEWSGFSDDESGKQDDATPSDEPMKKDQVTDEENAKKEAKKESRKEAKKQAKEKKAAKTEQQNGKDAKTEQQNGKEAKEQQEHSIKPSSSFAALEGQEDDDGVDISAWDSLGLSPDVLTGISKMKFATPTSIQEVCIPQILEGHDVVGKASTGSGKTLAFGIPILEHCLERSRDRREEGADKNSAPVALILSPTRELAHQLSRHISELASNTPGLDTRIALLTGGLSLQKQQRLLTGADIVIGTPGRMWEILSTGLGLMRKVQLIKFLVIDEADRLLSQGQYKELEQVLDSLDRVETFDTPEKQEDGKSDKEETANPMAQRQTLVFSATFHRDLQQKLSGKGQWRGGDIMDKNESMEYLLKKLQFREEKPKFIDVNPVSQMAENLKEGIVECGPMEKDLYLYTLLMYHPKHRTLVFTNSISAVRRLTQFLQALQLPALALHSSMPQKARLRSVERFSSPTANPSSILVATDVASRGLDIKGIDFVVHYHAPRTADAYVHRSGRTARAGATGKSVIICGPEEMTGVVRLAAKVHTNMAQKNGHAPSKRVPLESLELDRRIVARVKPRVTIAARITDSQIAKEKVSSESNWLRNAAEDLGVEYDSEEFESNRSIGRGRGGGRHLREKEAGSITKAELGQLRAELKGLLAQRVNVGVSEKYLTAGRVDIEALLRGEGNHSFLGTVDPLGF